MKVMKKWSYGIVSVLLCCIILGCTYEFYHLEQTLDELQRDINLMNIHNSSTTVTEYEQTIDFLENETIKYREFVEKQQDFLIWLVGIIGVGLTGLLAMFEIKGRKDISNIIREQYEDRTQEEIGRFIGGQEKLIYLVNCVKKEERAKNKKILFVFQSKVNQNLMEVYSILEEQGYQVEKIKMRSAAVDREIRKWTEKNDIIIYQVNEKEYVSDTFKPDESVVYARLAKECDKQKVYGILYCENNCALDRSLYSSYFYINNANYGLTTLERIFNLLYFI